MQCPVCGHRMWTPDARFLWRVCLACWHQVGHEPACAADLDDIDAILAEAEEA